MSLDDPATAEGDFQRTPFPHLLVYMADRRLTGTLALTEPAGLTHLIRFEWGAPTYVRPGDRHALFGELLVEAGVCSQPVIEGALAAKGVLGDVLILTGHADGDTLERIAGHQLELRLVRLFGLPPATVYRYFEGHAALDDVPGPGSRGDILHVLATGTRTHPRSAMPLGKLMEHLGEVRLGLHPDAVLDRFCFDEDESKVATAVLAGKPTFVELLSAEIAPADVVRRVVYLFLLTRQLDIGFGHGQRLPPLGIEETLPPVAVGRVALRAAMHRHGAAVPDPSGDGERAAVQPRTLRRRRPPISGPGTILGPDAEPPSDVCEPVSDIVEIGGAPDSRARESSTGTGGKGGDR